MKKPKSSHSLDNVLRRKTKNQWISHSEWERERKFCAKLCPSTQLVFAVSQKTSQLIPEQHHQWLTCVFIPKLPLQGSQNRKTLTSKYQLCPLSRINEGKAVQVAPAVFFCLKFPLSPISDVQAGRLWELRGCDIHD